jgi:hypothetical protein
MGSVGDRLEVFIGQDDACGGFHVRGENDARPLLANPGGDHLDGFRRKGRGGFVADLRGLDHGGFRGNVTHLEDLRPAVGEPAVADDHHLVVRGKLAGDRLHAEGAAAGHDDGSIGVIDFAEHGVEIGHDTLERLGHVIERTIGKDHREFHQTFRIHG